MTHRATRFAAPPAATKMRAPRAAARNHAAGRKAAHRKVPPGRLALFTLVAALPLIPSASALADAGADASAANTVLGIETTRQSFEAQFAAFETVPDAPIAEGNVVNLAAIKPPIEKKPEIKTSPLGTGIASYYANRFHGRRTANGERFNMNAMTAAHKTLPFGTRLRVTNPRNNRSVIVRINDRGPYIRGRTIDLSRAAAQKIGIIQSGHGRVKLERIES